MMEVNLDLFRHVPQDEKFSVFIIKGADTEHEYFEQFEIVSILVDKSESNVLKSIVEVKAYIKLFDD